MNQEYLGVALFPTVASCFNHSCDPNTFVVDIGRTQVTVASRRIFEGEEVMTNFFIICIIMTDIEKAYKLARAYFCKMSTKKS